MQFQIWFVQHLTKSLPVSKHHYWSIRNPKHPEIFGDFRLATVKHLISHEPPTSRVYPSWNDSVSNKSSKYRLKFPLGASLPLQHRIFTPGKWTLNARRVLFIFAFKTHVRRPELRKYSFLVCFSKFFCRTGINIHYLNIRERVDDGRSVRVSRFSARLKLPRKIVFFQALTLKCL